MLRKTNSYIQEYEQSEWVQMYRIRNDILLQYLLKLGL